MLIDSEMNDADLFAYSEIAKNISDDTVNAVLRECLKKEYVSDAVILPKKCDADNV